DEAFALLDELKKVKNYEALSAQIQNILRRATSTEMGPVPAPVAERIDKMIDVTRVLMQQYLQTDIVRELEVKLLGGAAPNPSYGPNPAVTTIQENPPGKLGESYAIRGHSLDVPKDFTPVPNKNVPDGLTLVVFLGPKRADESTSQLLVGVTDKAKVDPKLSEEQHLAAFLSSYEMKCKNWKVSEGTTVTINGLKYLKKSWGGILKDSDREIGGVTYVSITNGECVILTAQDAAPNLSSISQGEALLLTFK
ncbi:MAG: hypothetical protein ACK6DQ_04450, partial [Planctomycetota bacterium]